jgi:biopolymer transport protein ExbD
MKEREFDYINVIPLVDVMLVLLTIVLTTSTFIATGAIPVELPKASDNAEAILKTTVVEIDQNGVLYLNSEPTSIDDLRCDMGPLDRGTPILIRADRQIHLQRFVDILNMVKTLGFHKVSLQTEHKA